MLNELKKLKVFDSIIFLDNTHTYKINGEPSAKVSVTGLVGSVKEPFEENKWAAIKAKKEGCTTEEMKAFWKRNNRMSTYQGSTLHTYIENYYQNKVIPYDRTNARDVLGEELANKMRDNLHVLVRQFGKFYNDTKDTILPIKHELVIGDIDDTRICGMLDMLSYNVETESFEIYDFKTNKAFSRESKFNKYLLEPLTHLQECEHNTYSLQLSLYSYFIRKYTGIEISKLKIAWFSINNDDYKVIDLEYMPNEVDSIIARYKELANASN